MSVKYHINPDKGPLVCSASTPEKCRYGANTIHYESQEEAFDVWQNNLQNAYGSFTTKKKPLVSPSSKMVVSKYANFLNNIDGESSETMLDFANASQTNFNNLSKTLDNRIIEARDHSDFLNKCAKNNVNAKTLASMKKAFEAERNTNAEIVEALTESRFYFPNTTPLANDSHIGQSVKVNSFADHSQEWYEARRDSVGGSDIGVLASLEFDKNPPGYNYSSMKKIELSKVADLRDDFYANQLDSFRAMEYKGARYRGIVWEKKIRDDYASDHPELKVYTVEGQYAHPTREWQKVNLDGVVSDREDGAPTGILEIKTGSDSEQWKNGVPSGYRAQTLYYLNATGLEYADVRAVINDSETFEYRLNKNDEVVEGCGFTMEEYVNTKVAPWFEGLKTQRNTVAA